jgi:hypothetical protein
MKNGPVHVDTAPMMRVFGECMRLRNDGIHHTDLHEIPEGKFDEDLDVIASATEKVCPCSSVHSHHPLVSPPPRFISAFFRTPVRHEGPDNRTNGRCANSSCEFEARNETVHRADVGTDPP